MFKMAVLALTFVSSGSFSSYAGSELPAKAGEPAVYVAGGVQKPGGYDWFKGMTVLDAIKAAGGLTDLSVSVVGITITHADGTQAHYTFGPDDDAAKKLVSLNDGDTVYVAERLKLAPITPIAPQPPKTAN